VSVLYPTHIYFNVLLFLLTKLCSTTFVLYFSAENFYIKYEVVKKLNQTRAITHT